MDTALHGTVTGAHAPSTLGGAARLRRPASGPHAARGLRAWVASTTPAERRALAFVMASGALGLAALLGLAFSVAPGYTPAG